MEVKDDEKSPTRLESLPVEILLQIFAFFPLQHLVPSFFGLHSHIDSGIRSVRGRSHGVRSNDIDAIRLLRSFPDAFCRLVVVNADMVDLAQCMNLRSLTLERGTVTQLNSIRPHHLPMLEVLHIKALHSASNANTKVVNDLFEVVLSNGFPRLRVCTAVDIGAVAFSNGWTGTPSLRKLNLKTQTIEDDARLISKFPYVSELTTYEHSSTDVGPASRPGYRRHMYAELKKLEQLASEGRFIVDLVPNERVFDHQKLPPRFNNSRAFQRGPAERVTIILGRILPRSEPYRRASFLIEIALSKEYPLIPPEVTLLDPIYHPQVTDLGRCCNCNFDQNCNRGFPNEADYTPVTSISSIIMAITDVIDHPFSSMTSHNRKRAVEYLTNYPTFFKKAEEWTLSYGRPRY